MLNSLFQVLNFIVRVFSYAQGKGYGTATIMNEVKLVFSKLESPPFLAIDIGGNIGEYTAELRNKSHQCEIHIFEPSITNIEKLRIRFQSDNNIYLMPYALSNKSGVATLYSNLPGSGLGSLTKRKLDHFDIDFTHNEQIKTMKFEDYWLEFLNKRTIDIVKIDVEGHEFDVLNGFGQALKATRVIQFEFGGCNIDTRTYFQDFWYFFTENNFDIFRITPFGITHINHYTEGDEFFSTTNYVAVNRGQLEYLSS